MIDPLASMAGLVATVTSLVVTAFMLYFEGTQLVENPLVIDLLYNINLGLIMVFLISTFTVWKRLILYQKTKNLVKMWYLFEYGIFLSFGLVFLDIQPFSFVYIVCLAVLLVLSLILSANLKWVAYLNFKQKWRSIVLIVLAICYQLYFWIWLRDYPRLYADVVSIEVVDQVGLMALFPVYIYLCDFFLFSDFFQPPYNLCV